MRNRLIKAFAVASITILLAACGGGGGGTPAPPTPPTPPNPPNPPQSQTIAFAQAGTVNATPGSIANNVASGGSGSGAITYSSSNSSVASVDASTGAATAVGLGSAVITATKAADANFLQAQATYTLNVQNTTTLSAFIGGASTEVWLPTNAVGRQFGRARVADCMLGVSVVNCGSAEVSAYSATSITDTRATLSTPAYYALLNGSTAGTAIDVRASRFSGRIGHGAVFFNNRYWLIAGGEPVLPSATTTIQYTAKADVWSSADGKTWKLETSNAAFGARWFAEVLVYNGRIRVISGAPIGMGPPAFFTDVWSSADGVNWVQDTPNAGFTFAWANDVDVVSFNGAMWAVVAGRTYSSTTGVFTLRSAVPALTGATTPRTDATLTVYNNKLWYIGGKPNVPNANAMNDVWSSDDGITWTQLPTPPFAPRWRHASFVANNKLWVMGGTGATNGVATEITADAWSTTNGTTWTQESAVAVARTYLAPVVQEVGKATLVGGVTAGIANQFLQTTDGISWADRTSHAQFSSRQAAGVAFNGQMWLIGGGSVDGGVKDNTNNEVWRSGDGLNWSRVTTNGPIFSPRDAPSVLTFNNRLWVIGGWNNPSGVVNSNVRLNDVWSSADGVTWRQETSAASFSPRVGHASVAMNNRL